MHRIDALRAVCKGNVPDEGDTLVELAGGRVSSFADLASIVTDLRSARLQPGALRFSSNDISEDIPPDSNLSIVEYVDGKRWVRIWFRRGDSSPVDGWVPLSTASVGGVSLSLLSFVSQGLVLLVAGIACWVRPQDQPVRTFLALCSVSLVSYVAGNHWWVIAGNAWLIVPFSFCAVMLPAVLLHFAIVCPSPKPFYFRHTLPTLLGVYAVPALLAMTVAGLILAVVLLVGPYPQGPFGATLTRVSSDVALGLMHPLRTLIFMALGLAAVYFLATLAILIWSDRNARNALEKNQVRPLMFAALVAVAPVAYTFYLAVFHHAYFAFGGARLPMFFASLAFLLAYGVGIARYKLMLIDQVVSRGVWYYACSNGLTILVCALIAVGCVNGLQQDLSLFGHTVPVIAALMLSVLVLVTFRDALQQLLDRRFFSEKYQLDRALQRMNRVVTSVLEPEAVAESLLTSCREVLRVDHAILYMRRGERPQFRLTSVVGRHDAPLQLQIEDDVVGLLTQDILLQRIPSGESPAQQLIRRTGSQVVYGLEQRGQLTGLVALGPKPNGAAYTAEDVAFVTAMGRIAAVALHCVRVQEDVSRLNEDLRLKMDKIADQSRQITALQHELAAASRATTPTADPGQFNRDLIKGDSASMQQVLEVARKVAPSQSSVLLRGESGTGKELLARLLHQNSSRAAGPLVIAHCAAMSPALLESELFGHKKGAFTDAREDRQGRFAIAEGGTLFLDEIGDISLDVQVKLLRVLQERTYEPVGSNETRTADVRIIAATHRNLEQLIVEGKFREDLFYRLNVISITLPPLRDRRDDLFELSLHFLRVASEKSGKSVLQIEDEAFKVMQAHDWPGNIRELQNVIERAVVLTESDRIRLQDLPSDFRSPGMRPQLPSLPAPGRTPPLALPRQLALRRQTVNPLGNEREQLIQALERHGGNKTEAARTLGMPRSTFFSKLKKHGLA